jgi:GR25 family glycosyltransferase involved in LPS biosynthesis
MDFVDHIYYINLDYRTDRRLQFEDWIEQSGFPMNKVTRISATHVPGRGHLGCTLSHIKTLETFIQSPHHRCLVLEDDYIPNDIHTFWENFEKLKSQNIDFDLVMCAYNSLECEEGPAEYLKKVKSSFTSSGYLITKAFAPRLLENIKEAANLCEKREQETRKKADEFCIDVYWTTLMTVSKWYCFFPRIGKQSASYSDVQGHYTEYNA